MDSGKLDQQRHVLPRLVGSDVSNNEDLTAWKELLDKLAKELSALNTLVTKSGPKVGTHFGQYENIGQHMARTQIVLQSLQSVDIEVGSEEGSVEQVRISGLYGSEFYNVQDAKERRKRQILEFPSLSLSLPHLFRLIRPDCNAPSRSKSVVGDSNVSPRYLGKAGTAPKGLGSGGLKEEAQLYDTSPEDTAKRSGSYYCPRGVGA